MAQLAIEQLGDQAISEAAPPAPARHYIARGSMAERDKIRAFRRPALTAWLALIAGLVPGTSAVAAQTTLQVEASSGLPGFHRGELQRYLVLHMAEVGLGDWRFEPAAEGGSASDRVEWTFRLNPYAGGEVRSFAHTLVYQRRFGIHRPITIEARLYLNGEYQTLVEQQAIVQDGPDDAELATAIAGATQNLLGPKGAYRAIDTERPPVSRAR